MENDLVTETGLVVVVATEVAAGNRGGRQQSTTSGSTSILHEIITVLEPGLRQSEINLPVRRGIIEQHMSPNRLPVQLLLVLIITDGPCRHQKNR